MQRTILRAIYDSAIFAVDPYRAVFAKTSFLREFYSKERFSRLQVFGLGKAGATMAKAIGDGLGDLLDVGVVVTKYGHVPAGGVGEKFLVFEAGHPVPDENGVEATNSILQAVQVDASTLVVCLISGGGSALFVSPCQGVSLADKQTTTSVLLACGADIGEINTVRKHLSNVKGGRFAEMLFPARVISLIVSDVIGDHLDVIASGPTAPDDSNYDKALAVLQKYGVKNALPANVIDVLRRGAEGKIAETPPKDSPIWERVENIIIASNKMALSAAQEKARKLGFESEIISYEQQGEASEVGAMLAERVLITQRALPKGAKRCLIGGGETTVTLKGDGRGGRNTELALAFAGHIAGAKGISLLSAGTDGTDGPTDAAGAFADGGTVVRSKSLGLDWADYLGRNDSYNFFVKEGGLFVTGPTGTNVMDIQIIVIGG